MTDILEEFGRDNERLISRQRQYELEEKYSLGTWNLDEQPDEAHLFNTFRNSHYGEYKQEGTYEKWFMIATSFFEDPLSGLRPSEVKEFAKDILAERVINEDDAFLEHLKSTPAAGRGGSLTGEEVRAAAELWSLYLLERDP